jgi:ribonuclease P protein subunit POP4
MPRAEPATGRGGGGARLPASAQPDLARHELIGLACRVAASTDPGHAGVEGRVVDETMRTLVLATPRGERVVPKRGAEFTFTLPDGSTRRLRGDDLAARPEDRTRRRKPASSSRR